MNNVKSLTTFKAEIKRINFKKSYGDNIVTIIFEPCYIPDDIEAQLIKFQQMEEGLFEISIKSLKQ